MPTISDVVRARPQVMAQDTADGSVLVDMTSGNCFELNRVGQLLWRELAVAQSVGSICERLLRALDVPRDVLERDVVTLVEELRRLGLVETAPSEPAR